MSTWAWRFGTAFPKDREFDLYACPASNALTLIRRSVPPRTALSNWDVLHEGNEVGGHAADLGFVVATDGRAARYSGAEDGFAHGTSLVFCSGRRKAA